VHEIIKKYQDIIQDYQIELWENEPTTFRFKTRIEFKDRSILFVKDYLFPGGRKYVYHWQREDGTLLIRWDNAPHWQKIATYPHHKHVASQNNVVESTEVFLDDILEIIREQFSTTQETQD